MRLDNRRAFKIVSLAVATMLVSLTGSLATSSAAELQVGFAEADITPDVANKDVWVAGYGQNRRATEIHDPLMVRAVVFKDGDAKIAMACADVVGLQYPTVKEIRDQLSRYEYVMVSSTHNHEGPDTVGIWGPGPTKAGVDPEYMNHLKSQVVKAIGDADAAAVPVEASYGTAQDQSLLRDSREPYVYDDIIRVLQFKRKDNGRLAGIFVQWNNHPETMGGSNTVVTADFPGVTVDELKKKYDCPIAYFTGPVGGLMAPPRDTMKNSAGEPLHEGDFEFCRIYGEEVAKLAGKALDAAEPISLTGFVVSAKPIAVPLANPLYQAARMLGVLKRSGHVWTGDPEQVGDPLTSKNARGNKPAAETEVAYVRMGDLHVACIPGEVYPESVYGKIQDPIDPGADFQDAPAEKSVVELLPGKKILVIGLANDEVGYIVPKRQWDEKKPFAYGRDKDQYGEENSLGPETAPILYGALERRVQEAAK
ncbi:MAG: neutral/alkaline non-lysosomal ceramidase N-terminal domain-containing protein [Pirellulales bacterium]